MAVKLEQKLFIKSSALPKKPIDAQMLLFSQLSFWCSKLSWRVLTRVEYMRSAATLCKAEHAELCAAQNS